MPTEKEVFDFLMPLELDGTLDRISSTPLIMGKFNLNYRDAKDWDVKWRNHMWNSQLLNELIKMNQE